MNTSKNTDATGTAETPARVRKEVNTDENREDSSLITQCNATGTSSSNSSESSEQEQEIDSFDVENIVNKTGYSAQKYANMSKKTEEAKKQANAARNNLLMLNRQLISVRKECEEHHIEQNKLQRSVTCTEREIQDMQHDLVKQQEELDERTDAYENAKLLYDFAKENMEEASKAVSDLEAAIKLKMDIGNNFCRDLGKAFEKEKHINYKLSDAIDREKKAAQICDDFKELASKNTNMTEKYRLTWHESQEDKDHELLRRVYPNSYSSRDALGATSSSHSTEESNSIKEPSESLKNPSESGANNSSLIATTSTSSGGVTPRDNTNTSPNGGIQCSAALMQDIASMNQHTEFNGNANCDVRDSKYNNALRFSSDYYSSDRSARR